MMKKWPQMEYIPDFSDGGEVPKIAGISVKSGSHMS